jgi:hypothetical protein
MLVFSEWLFSQLGGTYMGSGSSLKRDVVFCLYLKKLLLLLIRICIRECGVPGHDRHYGPPLGSKIGLPIQWASAFCREVGPDRYK